MNAQTICSIGDQQLIEVVNRAEHRLVFAVPGVSVAVAKAVTGVWRKLGSEAVSVILDVDAAVCRLGYGTLEGLEELQRTAASLGALLCHQPGLRIGIVVSDLTTLVYTPTPLLIEVEGKPGLAGAAQPPKSNGIILSAPPEKLAAELGIGPAAQGEQKIGLDTVPKQTVKALAKDLKANPPLPFDIFRPVLVFNSQVEFVEFNLEKIQLQRQEIPIPPDLMGLTTRDIHGLFRLEVPKDLLDQKEQLEAEKRGLDREFTRPMRGFGGSIIRRSRKEEFLAEVEKLNASLEAFRAAVRRRFEKVAADNKAKLVTDLLPAIQRNPPKECPTRLTRPGAEAELKEWLLQQLSDSFAKVSKATAEMRVTVRFKGVTYESLNDREFIGLAQEAFPDLQLHEEFSAAREKGEVSPQLGLFNR